MTRKDLKFTIEYISRLQTLRYAFTEYKKALVDGIQTSYVNDDGETVDWNQEHEFAIEDAAAVFRKASEEFQQFVAERATDD